ncbi:fimbrial protein [Salmonella enterica]|nr:fimbrial protein [Salmonella enterica]EMD1227970.1 DUF5462 family protein [Salmonella enterica]
MKKELVAAALLFTTLGLQSALADKYSENTQYLGVVNGQNIGNSVVKVMRTPTNPVLYQNSDAVLPTSLTVRNAEARPASGNMVYITVKQALPGNREVRLTLKIALIIDGQRSPISTRQLGEDVVILVPKASRMVELRTDTPLELDIPTNYKGNLQVTLQVED